MSEKRRYIWLDIIKILACFFVIINHSHTRLFDAAGYSLGLVTFDAVFFSICKIAVPLFVMATGFLSLQKEVSFKKTLLRIVRILVPLILVSAYYYFRYTYNGNFINFITTSVANPQNVALWYLYMLIGLYLVIPFITKMVLNSTQRELGLFTLIFLIIPPFLQLIVSRLGHSISSYAFSAFFPVAVGYLVAGVYLSRLPLKRSLFFAAIFLFIASEIPVILSIINTYNKTSQLVYAFDYWGSLPVVIASVSFFYIFRFLFEKIDGESRIARFIGGVSATTFGIYLIHIVAIITIYKLPVIQSMLTASPYLAMPVCQIIVFVFCSLIIFVLRKIPLIRWFL